MDYNNQQVICLAEAMYYEARGDGTPGHAACCWSCS